MKLEHVEKTFSWNGITYTRTSYPNFLVEKVQWDWFSDNLEAIPAFPEALEEAYQQTIRKYYFVTYQATNRQGSISVWNQVIDTTPMDFIKDIEKVESAVPYPQITTYRNFVIIQALEITEEEYLKHKGMF